jgi:hypothetical protein
LGCSGKCSVVMVRVESSCQWICSWNCFHLLNIVPGVQSGYTWNATAFSSVFVAASKDDMDMDKPLLFLKYLRILD